VLGLGAWPGRLHCRAEVEGNTLVIEEARYGGEDPEAAGPPEILKNPYKDNALQQRPEELELVGTVWYSRWEGRQRYANVVDLATPMRRTWETN
jgi:hypothetical protein